MQWHFSLTTVILVSVLVMSNAQSWKYISIDPENGENTPTCASGSISVPCKNLTYAFTQYQSWTQFMLYPGNHYLSTGSVLLQNATLLSISSIQAALTTVFCINNSGLSFFNVTGISMVGLHFVGCSALQTSTNQNYSSVVFTLSTQLVGIFFNQCKDVNMSGVTVSDGGGAAGIVFYNTVGSIIIAGSSFLRNTVSGNPSTNGGGGVVVEFSYCIPGDNLCPQHPFSVSSNRDSIYTFYNCTFVQNIATGSDLTTIIPYQYAHSTFGSGGGLSISFNGNASNNTVQVMECSFENNTAMVGGGLFVHFGDHALENKLIVNTCVFVNNKCPLIGPGTSGGGLRVENYIYGNAASGSTNAVEFHNCQILGNTALNGGGLSTSVSGAVYITVTNCTFNANKAQNGAAIEASVFTMINDGFFAIDNCSFSGNSVNYSSSSTYPVGVGTVYINGVPVRFSDLVSFDHNFGTGVVLTGADADFSQCTALFDSNYALNGGAIALLGTASIVVSDQTVMRFYNNYASNFGGAIYNSYLGINIKNYANCFIHYSDYLIDPAEWNATFVFANNTSGQRGSTIYSTSLLPCTRSKGPHLNLSATFCWNSKWIYQWSSCSDEIASDISSIVLPQSAVSAIPGQLFQIPLLLQDDLNHTVPSASLLTATTSNSSASIVDPQYSHLSSNYLIVSGQEESVNMVELTLAGEQVWHATFPIHLNRCPPGMKLDSTASPKCICPALDAFQSSLYCDAQNFQTYLRNGFWLGVDKSTNKLVVALCPPNFCYVNQSGWAFKLPQNTSELDNIICRPQNRYGVVCGDCIEGFGPAVNSLRYECVYCESNFFENLTKYIFTVYVPLLIFFLIIFLFNIHLTTGPANGFIVYSQVVISTFALHGDYHIPLYTITPYSDRLLKAYQVSYGLFNLETFSSILHPFCLSSNMNTLNVLQLSYLVAIFPLLMVLTILIVIKLRNYRCCGCHGHLKNRIVQMVYRKIHFSPLHAFAAFLLLSYNRLCLTSTYMVNVQPLKDEYGNVVGSPRPYYVQSLDGTSTQYILEYKLIGAFILLTVILLPPLLLLGYPIRWFENYVVVRSTRLQQFYPVDKVNIFLDVFQGCYRDHRRYFASFYFFFRIAVNVAYFMTDTWIDQYNIQVVLCAIMVLLISVLRPYKKKILNYVDIAIFTDMLMLSLLSIYLYERADYDPYSPLPVFPYVVQYILIFLPLFGMVVYAFWLFLKLIRNRFLGYSENVNIPSSDTDLGNLVDPEFHSSFAVEDILDRADGGNSYVPFGAVEEMMNDQKHEAAKSKVTSASVIHLSERTPLN